ncbi:hypothetical protein HDU81_000732 [Chytriomyces hyalinus]|nr:hypothetical protein HDU81_000732 [Chytriomyces hyalinus]
MLVLFHIQTPLLHFLLQATLLAGIAVQYMYLYGAATVLTPTQWNSQLNRLFHTAIASRGGCDDASTIADLDSGNWYCNMTLEIANTVVFPWLGNGIHRMTRTERELLFERLDSNKDGVVAWPELAQMRLREDDGLTWNITGSTSVPEGMNKMSWGLMEIQYRAEVFSRVRDARRKTLYWVDGIAGMQMQLGNGIDADRPYAERF